MGNDERALLSAILADPANDTPRLQLADWLEEQGDADRAEFIRVQLELASMGDVRKPEGTWVPREFGGEELVWSGNHETWRRHEALRQREDELWYLPARGFDDRGLTDIDYTKGEPVNGCNRIQAVVRRGLVAEVHCTLEAWMGGPCQTCTGGEPGRWVCKIPDPKKCPHCNGAGTIPGHGPAIVAAHPVERVVFSDAVIHSSLGNSTYFVGGLGVFPQQYWSQLENLLSRQAAHDALSRVAIAWAKQQTPTG